MSLFKVLLVVMMSFAGMAYFGYGKKQQNMSTMIAGGLMMGIPYFVSGTWVLFLIWLALIAFPVVWSRM
ncbi:MAG: amino acid transport protein [Acidobacteria bacterium]|nr:amino acid transport protein [Acidobacteriota bacterium]